ncbi:uncharacterized protein MKK02DRAFT_19768 [Dioszegia hungarica]|uniref:Aminoglycoside phosphotransferase domain-containing protein n=1 Tax=Dioszegia hungarica TaxID=4972 RepID=A0AA38H3A5_9TREE|nr:uncharacterized protein MKK02DRAFT_19768 [Dioszegia hungarica]KAI9632916.1 hypothetical protein MKK02DRAFT_19768 [Dioszegia hungarica]
MSNPKRVQLPPLDHFTGDARVYERRSPSGKGRQVVKESVSLSERKTPQIFPDQSRISIRNEARAIQYVRKHTTIPVPFIVEFNDQPGAPVQLVTKFVKDGVPPKALQITPEGRARIVHQLEGYISQLQALTDPECRSFAGPPLFAVRFENAHLPLSDYKYRRYDADSPYVLCHGDLAWHNLLLDSETFEIKCVVDWEYAGFYPKEVESEYWRRPGPLAAMSSRDKDDKDDVLGVLWRHRVFDFPVKPASK